MELTIAERVENGIKFLDEKRPGWDRYIDLEALNIVSGNYCVLGQLGAAMKDFDVSGFDFMTRHLGLSRGAAAHFGFDLILLGGDSYFALTAEWKARILARRAIQAAETVVREADEILSPVPHVTKIVFDSLTVVGALLITLIVATPAHAQTPLPDPRADWAVQYDPAFDQVYTAADGPLAGQPYIQSIRLMLNAVPPATGTRVVTVPRGQLVKTGNELMIPDVVMPIGNFNVVSAWIDGTGVPGGASTPPVPFSASRPAPPAPAGLRISAQRP